MARFSEEWPISGVMINEYLASLGSYADTTVRQHFKVGKMVATYMRKAYKVENPYLEAETPKVAKKKRRYFSVAEMIQVLGACRKGYERELIITLIDSACRIGELVNLRGRDVKENYISVQGKTGEHRYRLDERICKVLRDLAGDDESFVFEKDCLDMRHRLWRISDKVRTVIERAGITGKKLGAHTLRHSSASLVAKKTLLPFVVKELLQHDDIDSTMVYIHDAEQGIAERVSPLELLGEEIKKASNKVEVKQIGLGEVVESSTAIVPFVLVGESGSLDDEAFPGIEDEGLKVRPLLRTEDVRLLRRLMVVCFNTDVGRQDALKGRQLLRRMLQKVKR
jgi:site-specific recombinase XerD